MQHKYYRYIGNLLTIIGYFMLLHINPLLGGVLKIIGFSMVMYSVWQLKMYDTMGLLALFLFLDLTYVLTLI